MTANFRTQRERRSFQFVMVLLISGGLYGVGAGIFATDFQLWERALLIVASLVFVIFSSIGFNMAANNARIRPEDNVDLEAENAKNESNDAQPTPPVVTKPEPTIKNKA